MYATITKTLTFEEFLAWDDGSGRDFELVDGVPVPLSEPNANHEDLIQRLCTYLEAHCLEMGLSYVSRQSKQVRLKTASEEKEKSRKADIVIFAQSEWQRMKGKSSSAAAYVPPPGVIEVVVQTGKMTISPNLLNMKNWEFWNISFWTTLLMGELGLSVRQNSQQLQFISWSKLNTCRGKYFGEKIALNPICFLT